MEVKISAPDYKKYDAEKIKMLFEHMYFTRRSWQDFQKRMNNPVYRSWEEVRLSNAIPPELNADEAFILLSNFRWSAAKRTPIVDENMTIFIWEELSRFRFFFDEFAKKFGVYSSERTPSEARQELRRKKIFEGTLEEAIASSQIEGAVITRKQGRELLETGRAPKSHSEKMVVNNYQTILRIENEWKHRDMSEDLLLEIQYSLTKGTLENLDEGGRFRKDSDNIVIGDPLYNETAFIPPHEKFMKINLQRFIDFANDRLKFDEYTSDLPRAIIFHFWLAYLHPFCDGNGRTARAIFYWYLLRKNYPYIGFLPISTRIRQSKRAYEKAFLLAEQDGNNLTYFFDYLIRQMHLSLKDFEEYETRLEEVERKKQNLAKSHPDLNSRQADLLQYFVKHTDEFTTFRRHQMYQGITYITARKDLLDLQRKGFLTSRKHGKDIRFFPSEKIAEVL